ncbi:MAG: hypothetical protein RLZ33_2649 [Bacteroidota bacterium]|jgi:hypothetical protein
MRFVIVVFDPFNSSRIYQKKPNNSTFNNGKVESVCFMIHFQEDKFEINIFRYSQ